MDFLDTGCAHHASLTQDEEHDKPVGWNILHNHQRAHCGICGHLEYYSRGEVSVIQSASGVQQGDPLGSLLFALGLHPLLLNVGHRNPSVFISAYADNCIITGPLAAVQAAVADFDRAILLA